MFRGLASSMKSLHEALRQRIARAMDVLRGVRKPREEDVFRRIAYIFPKDLRVVNYGRRPVATFNPGALVVGKELWVFPRLVFDYYGYVSSVGFFKLDIEKLLRGELDKPIETRVVLWPRELWEFCGCEDPRTSLYGGEILILYTGLGYRPEDVERHRLVATWVQGFAVLDHGMNPVKRGFFRVRVGSERIDMMIKDSAFIEVNGSEASMLCRPTVNGIEVNWRCYADLDAMDIDIDSMEPVMVYEEWELKIGWSTNTVRISSSEYLVGWHGVLREDYSYRNGLAVVDRDGRVLALSNYLLSPRGVVEEYGDRPLVVFGNGLVLYRDTLLWVGGVGDYAIGIFATPLESAMDRLVWIERS